jgi:hypothetical protein
MINPIDVPSVWQQVDFDPFTPEAQEKLWSDDVKLPAQSLVQPTCINFTDGNKTVVSLDCHSDPPGVWIDPDLAWDSAAKHFWNAVHRVVGRPAPFPDID